jgi:hypothetical protein
MSALKNLYLKHFLFFYIDKILILNKGFIFLFFYIDKYFKKNNI